MSHGFMSADPFHRKERHVTSTPELGPLRRITVDPLELSMNIYDPADGIHYIHMAGQADAGSSGLDDGPTCIKLPPEYANQSPPTRLQRRPPCVRADQERAAPLTA
jgi:hypothetical protein